MFCDSTGDSPEHDEVVNLRAHNCSEKPGFRWSCSVIARGIRLNMTKLSTSMGIKRLVSKEGAFPRSHGWVGLFDTRCSALPSSHVDSENSLKRSPPE